MAYNFQLVKLDNTTIDFTASVVTSTIKKEVFVFETKTLLPKSSTLSFNVSRDSAFIDYMMSVESKVKIIVTKDSTPYFIGYVTPAYTLNIDRGGPEIGIEVDDLGKSLFSRPWKSLDGLYTDFSGYKICDSTDVGHSFVHQVCALAGINVYSGIEQDTNIVNVFQVTDSEGTKYEDVFPKVLKEFGWTFYLTPDGKFNLYSIIFDNISTTQEFNSENVSIPIEVKKNWDANSLFKVTFNTTEEKNNVLIFSDTTNGTDAHTCVIQLDADKYYPEGATASSISTVDYSDPDKSEILKVGSIDTSHFSYDGQITVEFENLGKQGSLKCHNTGTATHNIFCLDVYGNNVLVKKADNELYVGLDDGTGDTVTYNAEYIDNKVLAQQLASLQYLYFKYAKHIITIKSPTLYEVGSIVRLNETIYSGIDATCVITNRVDSIKNDETDKYYEYELTNIGVFSLQTPTHEINSSVQGTVTEGNTTGQINRAISQRVTREEVINGFVDSGSGATNVVISVPAPVLSGTINNQTASLKWTVSELYSAKYSKYNVYRSLSLTGTYTLLATTYVANYTDANLPLGGTTETPLDITYYYKVALTDGTNEGTRSNAVSLEAYPITAGQISAVAKMDILNVGIEQINDSLVISDEYGYCAGPSADSGIDAGDRRNYITKYKSALQVYNSGWKNLISSQALGGTDNAKSSPSLILGQAEKSKIEYDSVSATCKLIGMSQPIKYSGTWNRSDSYTTYQNYSLHNASHECFYELPNKNIFIVAPGTGRDINYGFYDITTNTIGSFSSFELLHTFITLSLCPLQDGNLILFANGGYIIYDVADSTWGTFTFVDDQSYRPYIFHCASQETDGTFTCFGTGYNNTSGMSDIIMTKLNADLTVLSHTVIYDNTSGYAISNFSVVNDADHLYVYIGISISSILSVYCIERTAAGVWGSIYTCFSTGGNYGGPFALLNPDKTHSIYYKSTNNHLDVVIRTGSNYSTAVNVDSSYGAQALCGIVHSNGKRYIGAQANTYYDASAYSANGVPIGKAYVPMDSWELIENSSGSVSLKTPFNNFTIANTTSSAASAISNWTSFTPTINGAGTLSAIYFAWRRVGSNMEVTGRCAVGSVTAVPFRFYIPSGYTIDTSVTYCHPSVGNWSRNSATLNAEKGGSVLYGGGTNFVSLTRKEYAVATSPFTELNTSALVNTGDTISVSFSVPITQWIVNVNLATDFTEYASNSSSTDASDTSSFVTGSGGSVGIMGVTSITAARTKRIQFSRGMGPTDLLTFEIYSPTVGQWYPIYVTQNLNINYVYQNGVEYGVRILPVSGSTTLFDVYFGQFASPTGATYGANGAGWASAYLSNSRWRVRKTSNGNFAEVPSIVHCEYGRATTGQSVSSTPIAFIGNVKVADTANAYNTSTGEYTAPIAGWYRVKCSVPFTNTVSVNVNLQIIVAGVGKNANWSPGLAAQQPIAVDTVLWVNAGETVYTQIWLASSTNTTYYDSHYNYFQITWMGK